MNVSTNHISYYVNGTEGSNSSRNYIYPGWMPVANFGPATYQVMANMDISQGSQADNAIYDAFILWVKNKRYAGVYPTNFPSPDFSVSTPWIESVPAAGSVSCQVSVNPLNGFNSSVSLSASSLPQGVTASFSPASVTGGSGTSTLTLTASNTVTGNIYALTNGLIVYGTASIGVRSAPVTLLVNPQPYFLNCYLTGANLVMNVTNGFAGAACYLLGSTNLGLSASRWTFVTTNAFGTNGAFSVTNAINPATPSRFFILQY